MSDQEKTKAEWEKSKLVTAEVVGGLLALIRIDAQMSLIFLSMQSYRDAYKRECDALTRWINATKEEKA
jgi:hypothetical protein